MANLVGDVRLVGVLFRRIDGVEQPTQRWVSLPQISLVVLESQVVLEAKGTSRPNHTSSDLGDRRMVDSTVVEEVVQHSSDGVVQEVVVPEEATKTTIQETFV